MLRGEDCRVSHFRNRETYSTRQAGQSVLVCPTWVQSCHLKGGDREFRNSGDTILNYASGVFAAGIAIPWNAFLAGREVSLSLAKMPDKTTGGLSANFATRDRLPPMASIVFWSVNNMRLVRFSRRETLSWLMPSVFVMRVYVSFRARRSLRSVISSAISSAARASTFLWRAGAQSLNLGLSGYCGFLDSVERACPDRSHDARRPILVQGPRLAVVPRPR